MACASLGAMTFRDDHDAALARADALQVELERANAEKAELEAKLAARAEPAKPERAPSPSPPPVSEGAPVKRWQIAVIIAGVVGLFAAIFVPTIIDGNRAKARHDAWTAAVKAREAHVARWRQIISIEPCVRDVMLDTAGPVSRRRPDVFDPRKDTDNFGYDLRGIVENCGYTARQMMKDLRWPATLREPLRAWMEEEDALTAAVEPLSAYLSHRDWQEDDYRGGREMWAKLLAVIERRDAAVARVRAQVLPKLRAEMVKLKDQHLAQHQQDNLVAARARAREVGHRRARARRGRRLRRPHVRHRRRRAEAAGAGHRVARAREAGAARAAPPAAWHRVDHDADRGGPGAAGRDAAVAPDALRRRSHARVARRGARPGAAAGSRPRARVQPGLNALI